MTSRPTWNRGYKRNMYKHEESKEFSTSERPYWPQGIREMLEQEDYETIEDSFDTMTALAIASGKYDVPCPEQEQLASTFAQLPDNIKEHGYRTAIAIDAINDYMQLEDFDELAKGVETLIDLLKSPVLIDKLPRNYRLSSGLCGLFSKNGEIPEFFIILARTTYEYCTSFDRTAESQETHDSIDMYLDVYAEVLSS